MIMDKLDKNQIAAIDKEYYMPVFSRYPLVLSHGAGRYVYDVEGKRYLDFLAGIAVNVLGHSHPGLVGAIAAQAARLIHCSNLYYTRQQASLAERLAKICGMDKVFLANSGAEANEGAIKLARKYGKTLNPDRVEIITAENSFHGRTLATLTATAQPKYQKGYEPLPEGFRYVPFDDLPALRAAVSERTCAVILEPVQGEGGINIPSADYLPEVRRICDAAGALLIFDEIQSGMGRTGKMLASQHSGVKPDILTLAKGLGGGVPIGAFLASDKVAAAFHPGDHGTTFGGNPLACAAAHAVLDAYENEGLIENAASTGAYMLEKLRELGAKHSGSVKAVRGLGLMAGMQLAKPGADAVLKCLERGLLINCTAGDVLRFVPPLNVTPGEVDEMIAILDAVLTEGF